MAGFLSRNFPVIVHPRRTAEAPCSTRGMPYRWQVIIQFIVCLVTAESVINLGANVPSNYVQRSMDPR